MQITADRPLVARGVPAPPRAAQAQEASSWYDGITDTFTAVVNRIGGAVEQVRDSAAQVGSNIRAELGEAWRGALGGARDLWQAGENFVRGRREGEDFFLNGPQSRNVTGEYALPPMQRDAFYAEMTRRGLDTSPESPTGRLLRQLEADPAHPPEGSAYPQIAQLAETYGNRRTAAMTGTLNNFLTRPGPLDEGTRRELVRNGLLDVANPSSIRQDGGMGNCGGVALQRNWARHLPESYLTTLTELGGDRTHTFPNGRVMGLTPEEREHSLGAGRVGRTASAALMADALLIHAQNNHERQLTQEGLEGLDRVERVGRERGWHMPHHSDFREWASMFGPFRAEQNRNAPLMPHEVANVMGDIFNTPFEVRAGDTTAELRRAARNGQPSAAFGMAGDPHYIVPQATTRGDNLRFDSWGSVYEVTPDNARDHLLGAVLPVNLR